MSTDAIRRLKQIRSVAHEAFDRMWKTRSVGRRIGYRSGCYRWLQELTGLSVSECHFGNFDIGVCEAVLEAINEVEIGLREGPQYKPSGMTSEQRARRIERETRVAAEIHDHWWSQ